METRSVSEGIRAKWFPRLRFGLRRKGQRALKTSVNGDTKLLKSLVGVLRNDAPRLINKIETAIVAADAAALKLNAHTLKGSVLFLGDVSLTRPAQQLEEIGKSGDTGATDEALKDLKSEWLRLDSELESFVGKN